MQTLNNWNTSEVKRAESLWGHKTPQYTLDMFDFITTGVDSWLDLGCGFGRFLEYLLLEVDEPDYIGYDSSQPMIDRISERFPSYLPRVFCRSITTPINHQQKSIICSAVLIHITLKEQQALLQNLSNSNAERITFDINSPSEQWLSKGKGHFERHIKGSEGAFRMTWQSHYLMTKKVFDLFPTYSINIKFYKLHSNRHKVAYFLEKL